MISEKSNPMLLSVVGKSLDCLLYFLICGEVYVTSCAVLCDKLCSLCDAVYVFGMVLVQILKLGTGTSVELREADWLKFLSVTITVFSITLQVRVKSSPLH